jgi:hypothetical protein
MHAAFLREPIQPRASLNDPIARFPAACHASSARLAAVSMLLTIT